MSIQKPKLPVGGLSQGPNDLDKPPGDFLVADNVVHRRTGILQPLPGDESLYPDVELGQPARIFSDWAPEYSLRVTKAGGNDFGLLEYGPVGDGDPTQWDYAEFRPGETQCVFSDGRHILSGAQFVTVVENIDETSHSEPRRAGMIPPHALFLEQTVSAPGDEREAVIPADKVCAYTAVFRRKITGDRYIYSSPAAKTRIPTNGNPSYVDVQIVFQDEFGVFDLLLEGDILQLYRTTMADSPNEINDTYYLVTEHALTASEITIGSITLEDRTPDLALGEELYTNPGQEGSLKTNMTVPASSGVETFDGTTFYINQRTGPIATFSIPGSWGDLPLASTDELRRQRASGIGKRIFSGSISNGSPIITAVSANDRVGLAIGQLVYHDDLPGGVATLINFTGAGPYEVTLNAAFTATDASAFMHSEDAFRVITTTDSGDMNSVWVPLGIGPTALLFGLDLLGEDGTATPMPGLSATLDRTYVSNIGAGQIAVEGAQVNVFTTQPDVCLSFLIQVTNPQNYSLLTEAGAFTWYRNIPSKVDVRKHILWYSKTNQPEHVSPIQFIPVGAGTCYRLLNVQSAMLAFCSDGIFRIEGEGDKWFIAPVDSAARLVHPDCAIANNSTAFAWLESGWSILTEGGTNVVSRDAVGPALTELVQTLYGLDGGPKYIWGPQMAIDRLFNEVWLNVVHIPLDDDPVFYQCFILNTQTAKFTTASTLYTAMCYAPSRLGLLRGNADGLYANTSLNEDFKQATVLYLPVVDNAGEVKQWIDVNYFFANVPEDASGLYELEALFGGELTSTTNVFELSRLTPSQLFALHSLVPRRAARNVELVFGFKTTTTADETHPSGGYYFEFKGASVRVRRASQLVKR